MWKRVAFTDFRVAPQVRNSASRPATDPATDPSCYYCFPLDVRLSFTARCALITYVLLLYCQYPSERCEIRFLNYSDRMRRPNFHDDSRIPDRIIIIL